MPQHQRRAVGQHAEHRHGNPEMAEKGEGVPGIAFAAPDRAVFPESVAGQQCVNAVHGFLPDGFDIAALKKRRVRPGADITGAGKRRPDAGRQVPGKAFHAGFRIDAAAPELRQPGQRFRRAVQLFQGIRGGVLCPAEGGNIEIADIIMNQAAAEQFRFHPALRGQGVHGVVRLRVTDKENAQSDSLLFCWL